MSPTSPDKSPDSLVAPPINQPPATSAHNQPSMQTETAATPTSQTQPSTISAQMDALLSEQTSTSSTQDPYKTRLQSEQDIAQLPDRKKQARDSQINASSIKKDKHKIISPKKTKSISIFTVVISIIGLMGWVFYTFGLDNIASQTMISLGLICNLGIHDFLIGEKKRGLCHIALTIASYASEIIVLFFGFLIVKISEIICAGDCGLSVPNDSFQYVFNAIFILNLLWSLKEGIALSHFKQG